MTSRSSPSTPNDPGFRPRTHLSELNTTVTHGALVGCNGLLSHKRASDKLIDGAPRFTRRSFQQKVWTGEGGDGHGHRRRVNNLLDALLAHQIVLGTANVEDRKLALGKLRGHIYPQCASRAERQNVSRNRVHGRSDLTHQNIGRAWTDDIVPNDRGRRWEAREQRERKRRKRARIWMDREGVAENQRGNGMSRRKHHRERTRERFGNEYCISGEVQRRGKACSERGVAEAFGWQHDRFDLMTNRRSRDEIVEERGGAVQGGKQDEAAQLTW